MKRFLLLLILTSFASLSQAQWKLISRNQWLNGFTKTFKEATQTRYNEKNGNITIECKIEPFYHPDMRLAYIKYYDYDTINKKFNQSGKSVFYYHSATAGFDSIISYNTNPAGQIKNILDIKRCAYRITSATWDSMSIANYDTTNKKYIGAGYVLRNVDVTGKLISDSINNGSGFGIKNIYNYTFNKVYGCNYYTYNNTTKKWDNELQVGISYNTKNEISKYKINRNTLTEQDSFIITFDNSTLNGAEETESKETWISAYPNPASNVINIYSEKKYVAEVYDISGKKLMILNIIEGNNPINISELNKGLYLIKTTDASLKFYKE